MVLGVVAVLTAASRAVRGAPRAALLGLASAVSFALTAALLKEVTGRLTDGVGTLLTTWPCMPRQPPEASPSCCFRPRSGPGRWRRRSPL
ncbi:hypothetical protein SHKM778_39360 [Streptomyces sp. KM77-8]|uniref:Uncharacterized protein n=1 Tax=Streptomyces haneummycinicus TaxID=3074435 RepID=A0AAT9HJ60_9ACTN